MSFRRPSRRFAKSGLSVVLFATEQLSRTSRIIERSWRKLLISALVLGSFEMLAARGADRALLTVLQVSLVSIVILLMIAFTVSIILHIRAYRGGLQSPAGTPPPAHRVLDEDFVAQLPRTSFRKQSNETCPICLEDFAVGAGVLELPCTHCYHELCITPWLYFRSACCPMCKLDARESPPIRLRISSVIGSWLSYARSVNIPSLQLRQHHSRHTSCASPILAVAALEREPPEPPGAFH